MSGEGWEAVVEGEGGDVHKAAMGLHLRLRLLLRVLLCGRDLLGLVLLLRELLLRELLLLLYGVLLVMLLVVSGRGGGVVCCHSEL